MDYHVVCASLEYQGGGWVVAWIACELDAAVAYAAQLRALLPGLTTAVISFKNGVPEVLAAELLPGLDPLAADATVDELESILRTREALLREPSFRHRNQTLSETRL